MNNIRNFVIVAHVDHGKSTLADRFLELTGTVEKRKMQEQYLDTMELERERGITIKLQPVRMIYRPSKTLNSKLPLRMGEARSTKLGGETLNNLKSQNSKFKSLEFRTSDLEFANSEQYVLNLIDTPGHVDFSYEVSRSLAAVEGAILLVDASKGVQAQTLANLHLAKAQGLTIIPVVNKIDLPNARTAQVKEELAYLLEVEPDEILEVSGKTGENVEKLLERVMRDVPPPEPASSAQRTVNIGTGTGGTGTTGQGVAQRKVNIGTGTPKALIFDSTFDTYKGVIAYVRIFDGSFKRGDKVVAWATKVRFDVLETGFFAPKLTMSSALSAGDIGYIATGLKDPGLIRVGDTITGSNVQGLMTKASPNSGVSPSSLDFRPLPGYKEPKPVVFASFFPENAEDYDDLKDALGKLKLTDASLIYEPESSAGLGRGFRLGFLGMLHVEIISERLKREFGLSLIISTPSVGYQVKLKAKTDPSKGTFAKVPFEGLKIRSASQLPDPSGIESIAEPVVDIEIITPSSYLGSVMELVSSFRNTYKTTDHFGKETALLKYEMPLSEVITDFYDKLKSVSSGYASMSYELKGVVINDLVRLDILIAGELVEPFSRIVPKDKAYYEGRTMVAKLKEVVPPQWFEVAIQAVIGGKVIARESIRARRKDVTGYLYGGDVTRKMKLLEKQKKGKKKMKEAGRVNLPQEVFLKMLKR